MKKGENNFSSNLTYLIESKILTAKEISKLTEHNSLSLVSMWKTGDMQPLVKHVHIIAKKLNVTMDDLVCKNIAEVLNNNESLLINKYSSLSPQKKELANSMINTLSEQDKKGGE